MAVQQLDTNKVFDHMMQAQYEAQHWAEEAYRLYRENQDLKGANAGLKDELASLKHYLEEQRGDSRA